MTINSQPAMPDGSDLIQLAVSGSVAIVTINRSDKRNAMSLAMWSAIPSIFARLNADPTVRVVVLTGAGGNFSAGADIAEFGQVRATRAQATDYELQVDACCDAIMHSHKPTIAVVDGFCMGGGCHLAMSCDFRFAGEDAKFAIPAARLSVVYGTSGTKKLLALVGLSEAKRILYSGAQFDAAHGRGSGFVDDVAAQPMTSALAFAKTLASNAPLSISGAKGMLNALAMGDGALDPVQAEQWIDAAADSEDYREGRLAFVEKRKPVFTGR
ncbi:MAG: hypothetical protein RL678_1173 [Pseudomonadota bacterium]|jgi:enoyl-CoA hydratase/carnithine racemase